MNIELRDGCIATIDDADFVFVSGVKWRCMHTGTCRYAMHGRLLMHRVILGLTDSRETDHIDGDGLNNCRSNLRICTRGQNQRNRGKLAHSKWPFKGISKRRAGGSWLAKINVAGKRIRLGMFPTAEMAARAYDEAATKFHGEFARLNFPVAPEIISSSLTALSPDCASLKVS